MLDLRRFLLDAPIDRMLVALLSFTLSAECTPGVVDVCTRRAPVAGPATYTDGFFRTRPWTLRTFCCTEFVWFAVAVADNGAGVGCGGCSDVGNPCAAL